LGVDKSHIKAKNVSEEDNLPQNIVRFQITISKTARRHKISTFSLKVSKKYFQI
jgi:hypothetical protein